MTFKTIAASAIGATLIAAAVPALAKDTTQTVRFKAGASSASISGKLKGYDVVTYVLDSQAGQMLHVLFSPNHNSCYFNFTHPGANAADFMGDVSGNELSMRLSKSGKHTAQVYLMRSAARRGETCKYTISFEITG